MDRFTSKGNHTVNVNCLENKRCPKCGEEDEIVVFASMWVSLTDDGTDPFADSTRNMGGVEWEDKSPAHCPSCGYDGIMANWGAPAGDDEEQETEQ
jgi:ribosomal protein S27AE